MIYLLNDLSLVKEGCDFLTQTLGMAEPLNDLSLAYHFIFTVYDFAAWPCIHLKYDEVYVES